MDDDEDECVVLEEDETKHDMYDGDVTEISMPPRLPAPVPASDSEQTGTVHEVAKGAREGDAGDAEEDEVGGWNLPSRWWTMRARRPGPRRRRSTSMTRSCRR